ncbi:MAG: hypothetical protein AAFN70_09435, partial [Planctomycetota bacterium]
MRSEFQPFRPHPLLFSGHLQTLGTALLRQRTLDIPTHQQQFRVQTFDGDCFVLHQDRALEVAPTDTDVLLLVGGNVQRP